MKIRRKPLNTQNCLFLLLIKYNYTPGGVTIHVFCYSECNLELDYIMGAFFMPENLILKGSETVCRYIVERPFPRRGVFFFLLWKMLIKWAIVSYSTHSQFLKLGVCFRATLGIMVKISVTSRKVEFIVIHWKISNLAFMGLIMVQIKQMRYHNVC